MYGSFPNKRKIKIRRVPANLSYDAELYMKVKFLADKQSRYANEFIEEGMQFLVNKYKDQLPAEYK